MKVDLFKEILPSILQTKTNVFPTEESYKSYVPYVVNKALSAHMDCLMQANAMNMYPFLPEKVQYNYLLNTVRGYKRRFSPWLKKERLDDVDLVKEYYGVSYSKAKTMIELLSPKNLEHIRNHLDKGGRRSNNDE